MCAGVGVAERLRAAAVGNEGRNTACRGRLGSEKAQGLCYVLAPLWLASFSAFPQRSEPCPGAALVGTVQLLV